ncbi:lipolytic protein G-D-S-L family [Crinalium epipsammum PCC 9333]|uniref:Lipolytic protein G-D-S-L family n=1 Tax=Crinalium epipsammum PCC 9333 TaxID=1173022 RepID=K9W6Y9_9CYAN|nr:SGNH/GDSL hydrolase family protein [Crinalium epipsammum]AFZ15240.1 lipolytic protein G-D-S-L family [Crinalium epipsammum PCC 9333]
MVVITKSLQNSHPITELNVFGDSLSDVGTVFRLSGGMYPPNPPYFQGRYSNGLVWVEYLAESLNLSSNQSKNFAYGGATTGKVNPGAAQINYNSLVPDLLTQVKSFTQANQQANLNALYVIWAGANDYLQGVSSEKVPLENLTIAIASLHDFGAKKMLVGNLPDLGHLPATRTNGNSAYLSGLTRAHNQGLRRSLKLISQQRSDLQIATLDANTLYREAITNPAAFGFSNVISGCMAAQTSYSNPDQFLFWDSIHPTTAAHHIIGKTALAAIQDAGIINTTYTHK